MNPMLYFFPNATGLGRNDALLKEHGLYTILHDVRGRKVNQITRGGPGGHAGLLFAPSYDGKLEEDTANQEWFECADGAFWVGYWKEQKPGEIDLARADLIHGHRVQLGDGGDWQIPVARAADPPGVTHLPMSLGWTKDGEMAFTVLRRYRDFQEHVFDMFAHVSETGRFKPFAEVAAVAVEALIVNYRVGIWEATALGLLTTQNVYKIVDATFDGPAFDALVAQKKTSFDTDNTSPGAEG